MPNTNYFFTVTNPDNSTLEINCFFDNDLAGQTYLDYKHTQAINGIALTSNIKWFAPPITSSSSSSSSSSSPDVPIITGAGAALYHSDGTWSLGELVTSSVVPPISNGADSSIQTSPYNQQVTGLLYNAGNAPSLTTQPSPSDTSAPATILYNGITFTGQIFLGANAPSTTPLDNECYLAITTNPNSAQWGGLLTSVISSSSTYSSSSSSSSSYSPPPISSSSSTYNPPLSSIDNPTPPNPNGTIDGAAISITNKSGIPIYPGDGVFACCNHSGSLTALQLFYASINPQGGIFWDFGDNEIGSRQKGFNAAHTYSLPGTYTITLTVVIATPNISSSGVFSMVTGPSSIVTETVVISEDNRPEVTIFPTTATPIEINGGTKYILEADESGTTWTIGASGFCDFSNLSNVSIIGNGNPATIYSDVPQNTNLVFNSNTSSSGITIQGIDFDALASQIANNPNNQLSIFQPQGSGGITIKDCNVFNMGTVLNGQLACQNVLLQNVNCPNTNELVSYFTYFTGTDLTIIDCDINGSQTQWLIRNAPSLTVNNNINVSNCNITIPPLSSAKGGIRFMTGQFCSTYGNIINGFEGTTLVDKVEATCGPGIQSDSSETASPLAEYIVSDSNVLTNCGLTFQPSGSLVNNSGGVENYVGIINTVVLDIPTLTQGIWLQGESGCPISNVYVLNNYFSGASGSNGVAALINGNPDATQVNFANNWLQSPAGTIPMLRNDSVNLSGFASISNNLWPVGSQAEINGAEITPSQWEKESLSSGNPTGDVYENINLGSNYFTTINGVNYGANIPVN